MQDITDEVRKEIHQVLQKIIESKEQKTHGVKTSSFLIECSVCHKQVKKAFLVYNYKNKKFTCFDCYIKSQHCF